MMARNAIDGGVCFAPGKSYIGTATLDHQRQKVFAVVARRGDVVSFAHVRDVRRELAETCDGTEFVMVKDADGFDYFLSARADVQAMTRGAAFFIGGFGYANMLEGELAFTPEIGTNWHTPPLLGFPDGGFLRPRGEIDNKD